MCTIDIFEGLDVRFFPKMYTQYQFFFYFNSILQKNSSPQIMLRKSMVSVILYTTQKNLEVILSAIGTLRDNVPNAFDNNFLYSLLVICNVICKANKIDLTSHVGMSRHLIK